MVMDRAWNCFIALSITVALQACGDPSPSDIGGPDKQATQCDELPSYVCDDYPEQCRNEEVRVLNLDLECYVATGSFSCSERADCVEAEWFAETSHETFLIRGCVNNRHTGLSVIETPSEEQAAATRISCAERLRLIDEHCRTFSGDACPENEGCRVNTLQVLDPDRGCATGETYTECAGARFLQVDLGTFEFLPCE